MTSLFYRFTRALAGSLAGTYLFSRIMHHLDRPVFRLTGGRRSAASLLTGLPVLMLTTTGAKSGLPRTTPLLSLPVAGGGYVVIASNWGQKHYPGWYHNLRKHPQVRAAVQGQGEAAYLARETEGAEREALWQEAVRRYPGYRQYAQRVGVRHIPVILLEPLS
ncbi:MAG: nitroreductase family deazaflavin-dependent oxidoreductase [Caldilineales bacterium]|nr:nitroreductase family deazaflavin-dependent oxidoreductase [Caldilineales bacterium]